MRRTQIQLDERTYELLRRRAFEHGCSISALAREVLAQSLGTPAASRPRLTLQDFPFVGIGWSDDGPRAPISERHDEALAEELASDHGL